MKTFQFQIEITKKGRKSGISVESNVSHLCFAFELSDLVFPQVDFMTYVFDFVLQLAAPALTSLRALHPGIRTAH